MHSHNMAAVTLSHYKSKKDSTRQQLSHCVRICVRSFFRLRVRCVIFSYARNMRHRIELEQRHAFIFQVQLTHRQQVVWKLAQPQNAGTRYIRGRRTIYSYFTSNANRWASGRMFSSIKYEHFVQVSSNRKGVVRRAFQSNHGIFCLQSW